jgi:hypothetical protein
MAVRSPKPAYRPNSRPRGKDRFSSHTSSAYCVTNYSLLDRTLDPRQSTWRSIPQDAPCRLYVQCPYPPSTSPRDWIATLAEAAATVIVIAFLFPLLTSSCGQAPRSSRGCGRHVRPSPPVAVHSPRVSRKARTPHSRGARSCGLPVVPVLSGSYPPETEWGTSRQCGH